MLSHYVVETEGQLFNTVTHDSLPVDASEELLRSHLFLDGQEQAAVHRRLFERPITSISLKIIPTWACNLRCKHCFVLHKLVKEDAQKLDVDKLARFVGRLLKIGPVEKFGINFIGGEPTLRAKECKQIIERAGEQVRPTGSQFFSGITTNGTIWNRDVAELFATLDFLTFSLDGNRTDHNHQRIPLFDDVKGRDVFQLTLNTIKRCVMLGFLPKLRVQASLMDDAFDGEKLRKYHRELLMAGVTFNRITLGSTVPTHHKPEFSEIYKQYLSEYLYKSPCCKYRLGKDFVVDVTGKVYCDYFQDFSESCLGDLDTPVENLLARHKELILGAMPVLNDAKCKTCPVLGVCWGRCCNTDFLQPSQHCDPDALGLKVAERAKEGKLRDIFGAKRGCQ